MRQLLALLFLLAACSGGSGTFSGASGTDEGESEAEHDRDDGAGEGEGEPGDDREGESEDDPGTGTGGPFEPELGCDPPEFERLDVEPFVEVAAEVGLGDLRDISAVCWLDYDSDGDPDLYLAADGLVRNDGGVFSAVGFSGRGHGCLAFDYDSDGDPDLLTSWNGGASLFENQGGTFVDVSASRGFVGEGGLNESSAACDIEVDGDLDLVIANWPTSYTRLFVNTGGTFTEEAGVRGISEENDPKRSVLCADLDGDGFPEIMLAGADSSNRLYQNEGDGIFAEATADLGFGSSGGHGIAVGDYDLDGTVDVVVGASGSRRSFVFDCDPAVDPLCREISDWVGLGEPMDSKDPARGTGLFDFDQDGLVDLLVTRRGPTQLYWNEGGSFVEATSADFDASPYSRGTAFGDIDGDGDVDVVVANSSAPDGAPNGAFDGRLVVYRNEVATGNWLRVRLVGTTSNRQGVGAVVTVAAEGGCSYTAEQTAGGSFLATNELVLHFGLGPVTMVDVTVEWPAGGTSTIADVAVDQTLTVTEE